MYLTRYVSVASIRDSQLGGYITESRDIYIIYHELYLTYYVYSVAAIRDSQLGGYMSWKATT